MESSAQVITLEEWKRGGRWFAYGRHRIFYRTEGDGPPLLCLHGFPTSSWDWHRIWAPLVKSSRVVAPDMLGFGFSSKPADTAYTIAGQTDLIEALMRELGIDAAHLLLHDYGTLVAQELLARQLRGTGQAPGAVGVLPQRHRVSRSSRGLAGS